MCGYAGCSGCGACGKKNPVGMWKHEGFCIKCGEPLNPGTTSGKCEKCGFPIPVAPGVDLNIDCMKNKA